MDKKLIAGAVILILISLLIGYFLGNNNATIDKEEVDIDNYAHGINLLNSGSVTNIHYNSPYETPKTVLLTLNDGSELKITLPSIEEFHEELKNCGTICENISLSRDSGWEDSPAYPSNK